MRNRTISYAGKKVYVGIDVHKKTYSVTAICGTEIVGRDTMRSSPDGLVSYLKKRFSGSEIYTVYEAGFCGYTIHRKLMMSGIKNIVINAASLQVAANDKVKTDKRDSMKLAEQLQDGRLIGINIPTEKEELKRLLTRVREQFVKSRAQIAVQIKSMLHYFGMMGEDNDKLITAAYLKRLELQEKPEEMANCLQYLIDQWRFLTVQLKEVQKRLAEQAKEDKELERIYRSVPGVGQVHARVLANELGDLQRFSSEKKLFSYTGLTPSEHSSGDRVHKGHISRQGSSRIRKHLVEIAWRAIRIDDALKEIFGRIAHRRGSKRAIVAIARKIIGRIRSCFRQQCEYQVGIIA